ncbi:MAG: phosphoribosylglycinamide formyltransferase [Planctomycetes bacterium]|nr:phosphoribosylglycinamide formyltransferase [Planctomycetota bacterium]
MPHGDPSPDEPPAKSAAKREQPLRLGVLISGGGTTMTNLAGVIARGELDAKIAVVISSSAEAGGVEKARKLGLPVEVVARKGHDSPARFSDVIFARLRDAGVELVCLAGFLCLLTIPDDFAGRIINIHPALLPSFGGKGMHGHHVHAAVIAAGCKVSGCTVHYADQTYDTGPIIVQRTCPVLEGDTPDALAARVFEQECLAYPEAIRLIAAGRIKVDGRRARIAPVGE